MRPIYAEDVKKQIDDWLEVVGYCTIGKDLSYYWELLGCIDDAPTIEPYGTWIPCSERLPGMGKRMLTTDIRGHVTVNKVLLFCDDVPVFDSYYRTGAERIIAWMPLPLPYREEKNDE